MPTSPGLELWLYQPNLPTPVKAPYGALAEELTFTTCAPGGCRDLTAKLHVPNARLPYPELAPFARVALMSEGLCVWHGELQDPELALSEQDGEYLQIQALGWGSALKDDPISTTYVGQTVQQMAIDQVTGAHGGLTRTNFLPFDADVSALFPDNPGATYSPTYPNYTMQDVFANLCALAGDYHWGVWPHPLGVQPSPTTHVDAGGFPTPQVQIHLRDTSTVHHVALEEAGDVKEWHVVPSGQRAYNVVQIAYNDPSQNPPIGIASYVDPRLNANGSRGGAPFRRRVFFRDLSGVSTVTQLQAQSIANAYGALFKNVTNKIEIVLRAVRDGSGNPIPLWMPWADRNIKVPTLSVRGQQLPTTVVAGTNLFYIVETSYAEQGGDPTLTLQCDNFVDTVESVVTRLQLESDLQNRAGNRTTGAVQALGASVKGPWSVEWGSWGTAGGHIGGQGTFPATLSQTPTSVNFATAGPAASNVGAGPVVSYFDQYGFHAYVAAAGAGAGYWVGHYTTVGNCLLDVDEARGTFDHHCDGCGLVRRGLSLKRDLGVHRHPSGRPERHGLTVTCPVCGTVESFNCNLGPEDEEETHPHAYSHRTRQARLIRAAMRHPHVALETREHPVDAASLATGGGAADGR